MENSLGYALYLVHSISKETALATPLSENKQVFLEYITQITEFSGEVEKYDRKQEMQAKAGASGDQGFLTVEFGDFQSCSMKEVYGDQSKEAQALINCLVRADARPNTNMAIFKQYVLKMRASASHTSTPADSRNPGVPPSRTSTPAASRNPGAPPSSTVAASKKPSLVKGLLARGKHPSPLQVAKFFLSPLKSSK